MSHLFLIFFSKFDNAKNFSTYLDIQNVCYFLIDYT